ncbi:Flp family type IVb pilin [Pseudarthrobacter sp. NamE5]|uniref:Flp family type IVb pilin n=1 Tax=Pseudarthrobacter sp. NamE5 TaxID=2576839 RepID=UPI00110AB182|nr:Flp family type IVb pilin [Pseudarthrobacter sp. NamE5]TLM85920.1 Flp family type IVb pilin [Pseudarthrobacter sp. NamE5]
MNNRIKLLSVVTSLLARLRKEQRGATATEYGILVGFIAIVIVAGVGLFGVALDSVFGFLTTGIKTALGIP